MADNNSGTSLQKARATNSGRDMLRTFLPVAILLLLVVISSFLSSNFFTPNNIFNLLRQNSDTAIISLGMLLVVLTGGIDLSVGSLMAFASVLFSTLMDDRAKAGMGLFPALLVTLLLTSCFGLLVGYLVAYQKLPPFVVTLASMTSARGAAFMISRAKTIPITNDTMNIFFKGSFFKVPFPVWLAILIFAIIALLLNFTSFGRLFKGIGSNENAVRLSGVRTNLYVMSVYVISSILCVFGGIIASRTGVGDAKVASGAELDAIAACVIGGANLSGGTGGALNTLMGVLILGLIGNIMALMNVASYPQQVIKGVIIIAAVLLQRRKKEA